MPREKADATVDVVTVKNQVDQTLKESEEYHRSLFEDSPTALCLQDFSSMDAAVKALQAEGVTDIRGYLVANPGSVRRLARLVTFIRVNQSVIDLYKADSAEHMMGALNRVLVEGDLTHFIDQVVAFTRGVDEYEVEARNHDLKGGVIDVIVKKVVINRAKYGLSRVMTSVTDVTDLHRIFHEKAELESRLKQVQKMEAIGTLAGGIAHDFNNLLMGILGNASLVLSELAPDSPHADRLKSIEDSVRSAAALTRQLLGFARGGKYEVKPTDINEMVENTIRIFGRTRKQIDIQTAYQQDVWRVAVDRGQMEQVLLNLFINAWQAMPGGGTLSIDTSNQKVGKHGIKTDLNSIPGGDYAKIRVADTGVGMDAETMQRIFEPFFTTKEMSRGTGLGLASVYGIVKHHGGYVEVASESGRGAAFSIYLPSTQLVAEKTAGTAEDLVTGSEAVLIVDDEKMVLEIGRQMLERLGYIVHTAEDAAAALSGYAAHGETIALVILDMIMPGMGGGELFDRLKKMDPAVKVLLSSGYSLDGEASEIMARGCAGFIQKPFDLARLSQKIRAAIDH